VTRAHFTARRHAVIQRIVDRLNLEGVPVNLFSTPTRYSEDILIGLDEVAAFLGRQPWSVRRLIDQGQLAVAEVEGLGLIAHKDLVAQHKRYVN
jgi:hypothetical protein